jgi:hypothetical protein
MPLTARQYHGLAEFRPVGRTGSRDRKLCATTTDQVDSILAKSLIRRLPVSGFAPLHVTIDDGCAQQLTSWWVVESPC